MDLKKQLGLAADPDALVEGMSGFLQQVGYSTSFLEKDENQSKEQGFLWQCMTRGITNQYSIENKIFEDNIKPLKHEAQMKKERREKRERQRKKKMERKQMLEERASSINLDEQENERDSLLQ